MSHLKHVFAIGGSAVVTALLFASLPDRDAQAAAHERQQAGSAASGASGESANSSDASQPTATAMPVVIIKGKRPSAREKRRMAVADSV